MMTGEFRRDIRRALLRIPKNHPYRVKVTSLSLSMGLLSSKLHPNAQGCKRVHTPHFYQVTLEDSVCAVPFSIDSNKGITIVFFSFRY